MPAIRAASLILLLLGLATSQAVLSGCAEDVSFPVTTVPGQTPAAFATAAECGSCHPNHYEEWEASTHASGGKGPIFLALTELAAQEGAGESCRQCHAPTQRRARLLSGDVAGRAVDLTHEGVTCDVCHSIADVPPISDVSFLDHVDPLGPKYANMSDPIETPGHASERRAFYSSSIACAPCHQVNAATGAGIENTFVEWDETILSGMGVECQTCHMPTYTGQAATDAPIREGLHRHTFVGPDYSYDNIRGIDLEKQKDDIRALLSESVTVTPILPAEVDAGSSFDISISVLNDRTGHSLPSGVSFVRDVWLQVTVRDGENRPLYRSGWLEPNGDLVAPENDPDLVAFGSTMLDASGSPTLFTWRATDIDDRDLLKFQETRVGTYVVPVPADTPGPLSAELALRFRPIKPIVARALGLERLLPFEIFDMWTESATIGVR